MPAGSENNWPEVLGHAVISAAVGAVISGALGAIVSIMMRPATQKLESIGFFNIDTLDVLEQYGIDLIELVVQGKISAIAGNEEQAKQALITISMNGNVVVTGPAGSGKTALVEQIAFLIEKGMCPENLKGCKIYKIDFPSLIVGKGYGGDPNGGVIRLRALFEYAQRHPEVILFIDEMHQFAAYGELCKTYMDRGQIKFIGATTDREYNAYVSKEPALDRRFTRIIVSEPSREQLSAMIDTKKSQIEEMYGVSISREIAELIIYMDSVYMPFKTKPASTVRLLERAAKIASEDNELKAECEERYKKAVEEAPEIEEEVVVPVKRTFVDVIKRRRPTKIVKRMRKETVAPIIPEVNESHVRNAVSSLTNIPLKSPTPEEQLKLSTMNARIKRVLRDQDRSVDVVCEAVRKARFGMSNPERLRGAFLLAGPSGVGKTFLAEMISAEVGSGIFIDSSQYNSNMSDALLDKVGCHPCTTIVFDGVDKAKPAVLGEISSILDTGKVIDKNGISINFRNTFILLTVNTGVEDLSNQEIYNHLVKILGGGIVGKVDDILIFNRLSKEALRGLIQEMMDNISLAALSRFGVKIEYDDDLVQFMIERGRNPLSGVRGLMKSFNTFIVDYITNNLMNGSIVGGDKVILEVADNEIKYRLERLPKSVEQGLDGENDSEISQKSDVSSEYGDSDSSEEFDVPVQSSDSDSSEEFDVPVQSSDSDSSEEFDVPVQSSDSDSSEEFDVPVQSNDSDSSEEFVEDDYRKFDQDGGKDLIRQENQSESICTAG